MWSKFRIMVLVKVNVAACLYPAGGRSRVR